MMTTTRFVAREALDGTTEGVLIWIMVMKSREEMREKKSTEDKKR
jgi:hypothetical protein